MSSSSGTALESTLTNIQLSDYASLIVLISVVYDYILTISVEVEYVWAKPWTWVSALFILVRYAGLWNLISLVLSQFMKVMNEWLFCLFIGSADLVMILRVWAMYNRSTRILGVLLALLLLEMVSIFSSNVASSDTRNMTETTMQVLKFSIQTCKPRQNSLEVTTDITKSTLGATLCVLAIARFVGQSLQMYHATTQWQLNRYMNLLIKEGILYFLVKWIVGLTAALPHSTILPNIINVLTIFNALPTGGLGMVLLFILQFIPLFILPPRFIISIRVLYAQDVWRRGGNGIDTGFGLSIRGGASASEIMFADTEETEEIGDAEGISREGGSTSE